MGRIYTGIFSDISVSAIQEVWELLAPSDAIVRIHGLTILQSSDLGDASEEIIRVNLIRVVGGTSGSGGATVTPATRESGDTAFGGSLERNNTSLVTGGTLTVIRQFGWNIRIPLREIFTPEERPIVSPGNLFMVRIPAPADALTVSSEITFEEIGG